MLKTSNAVTRIAICLDASASMGRIRKNVVDAFNRINNGIKRKAAAGNRTIVSLYTFNSKVHEKFLDKDASILRHIEHYEYHTEGCTELFECVIQATSHLHRTMDITNDEEASLVLVVTDGEQYPPNPFARDKCVKLIEKLQATGAWTFVFNVPPRTESNVSRQFGIPIGNIKGWDNTELGAEEMEMATTSGLDAYFDARAKGARSVQKFFVTADLASVSEEEVKAMPDLSEKFKSISVDKEVAIRDFVENKYGPNTYVIGSGYYQLTKKEKVQANKLILVRKRGEKKVYGGKDGRRLLGLPKDAEANVDIGNLSNYEVFVQSTSVNRKLVRGTTLLLDVTQKTGLTPTWDHVAAEQAKAAADAVQAPPPPPTPKTKKGRGKAGVVLPQHKHVTAKGPQGVYRDSNGRFASRP